VGAHERHFLDPDTARATLHSFHWLASGTMAYAALTGVLLWMSSIAAGWVENWAVYRRLPEAIEEHRVRRFVGVRAMRAVARWFAHHIAGFGGNVTLGFLLGMTPILGKFFGLPLDVRHVTLSTSAWLFSVLSLGFDRAPVMLPAAIGVATMAALNFGVSFFLAISVALRAKHVPFVARWRLLRTVIGHFFRHPGEFFFPPRA
jgi:site-specific recombinase